MYLYKNLKLKKINVHLNSFLSAKRYFPFSSFLQNHVEQLQERIRCVQGEKAETQKQVSSLSVQVAELDATRSALVVEVEGLRRALDGVKRQLANKDQTAEDELERVKNGFRKK